MLLVALPAHPAVTAVLAAAPAAAPNAAPGAPAAPTATPTPASGATGTAPPVAAATHTFRLQRTPDGSAFQLVAVATPTTPVGTVEARIPDDPGDVSTWWRALPQVERTQLELTSADVVRNLDGVPIDVRDRLNRQALTTSAVQLARNLSDLAAHPPKFDVVAAPDSGFAVLGPAMTSWETTFTLEHEQLAGIESLSHMLDTPDTYLISFDLNGRGHAAVAYGNPDTAANLAVIVPGTGADLTTISGELDHVLNLGHAAADTSPDGSGTDGSGNGSGGSGNGSDTPSSNTASTPPGERRRGDAGVRPPTAVVEWIGYDTPYSLGDATSMTFARDGVSAFTSFMSGLADTHVGAAPHLTVIGHSYGSLLVGLALSEHRITADDVVFIGSPGVGVDNVAGLHMDGHHVWAALGDDDWVRTWALPFRTPARIVEETSLTFGPDPHSPGFGAQPFAAGGAQHSQYFDPAYPALANMAAIVVGDYQGVTPAQPPS